MSLVHAFACDHALTLLSAEREFLNDQQDCPAISRAATTLVVLSTVAGRDGWTTDGARHLCPSHAPEATR